MTSKVRLGVKTASGFRVVAFDAFPSNSSPTFSNLAVDNNAPLVINTTTIASLAVDGSTVNALWSRSSDSDLYRANDGNTDTYATPASEFVGTIEHVSSNISSRGGSTVLAYIVLDGTTVKYDEFILQAAAPATSLIFKPHPFTPFLVR